MKQMSLLFFKARTYKSREVLQGWGMIQKELHHKYINGRETLFRLKVIRSKINIDRSGKMKAPRYLSLQWNLKSNLDMFTSWIVVDAFE